MAKKTIDPYQKAARFKKTVRIMVMILSILTVDLMISYLNSTIIGLGNSRVMSKLSITLIGMGVVIALFFVLVEYLNSLSEYIMKFFVDVGRNLLGRKRGLFVTFALLFFLIFCGYYYLWFNRNFPAELYSEISSFFKSII